MLNFAQFRLLTFDCYGTLIDWETGIFSRYAPFSPPTARRSPTPNSWVSTPNWNPKPSRENSIPIAKFSSPWCAASANAFAFSPTDAEIRSLPRIPLPNWLPFPPTQWRPSKKLKARYQLAVISNVDDDLFAATARRLEVPFDYVITAQQARAYKPSLQMFKLAQQRTAVAPSQWLHVAQSIYHDVVPSPLPGNYFSLGKPPSPRPGSGAAKSASAQPDLEVPDLKTLAELTENREL